MCLLVSCKLSHLKWHSIRKDLECEILQQETLEIPIVLENQLLHTQEQKLQCKEQQNSHEKEVDMLEALNKEL